jgi:hypothetical protein
MCIYVIFCSVFRNMEIGLRCCLSFIEDDLLKADVSNSNDEMSQTHEYFGTLKCTTSAASAVTTHLSYIRSRARFSSTVLNLVQYAPLSSKYSLRMERNFINDILFPLSESWQHWAN